MRLKKCWKRNKILSFYIRATNTEILNSINQHCFSVGLITSKRMSPVLDTHLETDFRSTLNSDIQPNSLQRFGR